MGGTTPPLLAAHHEDALLAFEAAWEAHPAPPLRPFVPVHAGPDFLLELVAIDLERRAGAGLDVVMSNYLSSLPELEVVQSEMSALIEAHRLNRHRAPAEFPLPNVPGYRLVRVIGAGGMSVVYEAEQLLADSLPRPSRQVAIKLIKAGTSAQAESRERFRTEIKTLAAMRHVNIVTILDAGTTADGLDYLAMEYLPGGTLSDSVRPPDAAARLIETLARAVGYLHQHHIVHRDLKFSNVLLTGDGKTPKITDFGLAKQLDDGGATTTIVGTPLFMPPEQLSPRRDRNIGPPADVYALGVMLYRLLTGSHPFPNLTPESLGLVIAEEPIALRRHNVNIPADIETICAKCLEKQPSRRYANGDELADDLGRYLRRRRISARPVTMCGRLIRNAERHPRHAALILFLAIALATACIAGVVGAWRYTTALHNAKTEADSHRVEADRQRRIALENVRRIVAEIRDLENSRPELDDVRRQLLTAMQGHLSVILNDPAHLVEGDETNFWLEIDVGDVYRLMDQNLEPAEKHFLRARAIAEALPRRENDGQLHQRLLSYALSRLSDIANKRRQWPDAEKLLQEMLTLRINRLAIQNDQVSRSDLAVAHLKMGDHWVARGTHVRNDRWQRLAAEHHRQCHALYAGLVQDFSNDFELIRMFAHSMDRLGGVHAAAGHFAESLKVCSDANALRTTTALRFPKYANVLTLESDYTRDQMCRVCITSGRLSEAIAVADQSLLNRQAMLRRNPYSDALKNQVFVSAFLRCRGLIDSERHDEAKAQMVDMAEENKLTHSDIPASLIACHTLIGVMDQMIDIYGQKEFASDRLIELFKARNMVRQSLFDRFDKDVGILATIRYHTLEMGDIYLLCGRFDQAAACYHLVRRATEGPPKKTGCTDAELKEIDERIALVAAAAQPGFDAPVALLNSSKLFILQRLQTMFLERGDMKHLAEASERIIQHCSDFRFLRTAARGFAAAADLAPTPADRQINEDRCRNLVNEIKKLSDEAAHRIQNDRILSGRP